MSEKKRRDITLGEMQDECSGRLEICAPDVQGNGECKYFNVCKQMRHGVNLRKSPQEWDLSDPPRFNEAQMALLRWWYERGAIKAGLSWDNQHGDVIVFLDIKGSQVGNMQESSMAITFKTESYFIASSPLDLTELLGKDGAEC